jgi:hypothetical protein
MTRVELSEHVLIIQAYSKLILVAKTQDEFNYAKTKMNMHCNEIYLTELAEEPKTEISLAVNYVENSDK